MDLYTTYDHARLPWQIEQESLWAVENTKPFFEISNIPGQCVFELYHPPHSLLQWCASNSNPFGANHKISIQRMRFGDCLLPHIDGGLDPEKDIYPREYAINYLLSESGPVTEWYRTQDLESVYASVVFPSYKWHKIKTDTLHGVRNIKAPRIAITMIKYWTAEEIANYKKQYNEQTKSS